MPKNRGEPKNVIEGFTPPSVAPGAPAGSFPLSGFDTVSPYSGKINFVLPLRQIGGRGEAGYTVNLVINQSWMVDLVRVACGQSPTGYCYAQVPKHNWWTTIRPGYGPAVAHSRTASELLDCTDSPSWQLRTFLTRLTITMGDGSEIEMRDVASNGAVVQKSQSINCASTPSNPNNRGKVFKSYDGSAMTFVSDTDITDQYSPTGGNIRQLSGDLHFPNGVTYEFDNGRVTRIVDRNGNTVTFTYNGSSQVLTAVDSLGRTTTFSYGTNSDTITYSGYSPATRTITINRTTLANVATLGSSDLRPVSCIVASGNPCNINTHLFYDVIDYTAVTSNFNPSYMVSSVVLPHGQQYSFKYNRYAELEQVTLPTGGKFEYTNGSGAVGTPSGFLSDMIFRRVNEKRHYPNGSTLAEKTLFASTQGGTGMGTTTATVQHQDSGGSLQAMERHTYYGRQTNAIWTSDPTAYSSWKEGKEYLTERLDKNGSAVLRTVAQTWVQRAVVAGEPWPFIPSIQTDAAPASDPRMTVSTETLDNSQVRKTEYDYDLYNNRTKVREYHFDSGTPGGLARMTQTTFQTGSTWVSAKPTGAHQRRVPTERKICTDSGCATVKAWTKYSYDQTTVQNNSGMTGYVAPSVLRGNMTTLENWKGSSSWMSTLYKYDIAGNVWQVTDPRGNIGTITYGSPYFAFPTGVTKGGLSKSADYDLGTGQIKLFTDENGVQTTFAYNDSLDRLTQVIAAANVAALTSQTTIVYVNTPLAVKATVTRAQLTYNDNKLKNATLYDGYGRVQETQQFTTSTVFDAAKTEYDALGRVWRTSNLGSSTNWTTLAYDALSRVATVTSPGGAVTTTFYKGQETIVKDPATTAKRRFNKTDALGRLIEVREDPTCQTWETGCPGGTRLNWSTSYVYDILDNLTNVTQGSQSRTFVYDTLSRLTSAASPESGTTSYTYDNNGNVLTRTDARSITRTNTYNALDQIATIVYSDSTGSLPTPWVTYYYGTTPLVNLGRLIGVQAGNHYRNYAVDRLGRITQNVQANNGTVYTFNYTYNRDNTLVSVEYPSLRKVTYTYDGGGRTIKAASTNPTATDYVSSITYAPHWGVATTVLGNGKTETTTYNTSLQPTQIAVSGSLMTLAFGYGTTNNNGNVLTQTITATGVPTYSQTYAYDDLNRILSVNETGGATWNRTYTYDRYGNRAVTGLQVGVGTPTSTTAFTASSNRLTSTWANYDSSGNQTAAKIAGAQWSAAYDGEMHQRYFCANTIAACTMSNASGAYSYDGEGNRIQKLTAGVTTNYVYDAFGQLAAEYTTGGPAQTAGRFFRTTDHLGSTRLVTNSAGGVVSRRDSFPFGEQILANASSGRTSANLYNTAIGFPQLFTGKERDVESGLDYFLARYYSAGLGRFTSPDPLLGNLLRVVTPQRWNAYSYAVDSPLVYVDPTGLDAIAVAFPKYRIGSSGSGVPYLGHAGIVLIERDGSTTYREYGRYAPDGGGLVQPQKTPNVTIGQNGLPTRESLKALLSAISTNAGKGGSVVGAYYKTTDAEDAAMKAYLNSREQPNQSAYNELFNNCQTFCSTTLFAGGQLSFSELLKTPARPISAIEYLNQLSDFALRYEHAKGKDKFEFKCNGILGCEDLE